jgi:uncharacterized membrane protein
MERVEKSVEVECPVSTAYNQWTQFEEFPKFMDGVREVRQLDDTHLHWSAEVWGKDEEWDAEITEQVPDRRISWRSTSGATNAGTVRFDSLAPDRTRVHLLMAFQPQGALEKAGEMIGAMNSQIERSLESFKSFIEQSGLETGEWRGRVSQGQTRDQG